MLAAAKKRGKTKTTSGSCFADSSCFRAKVSKALEVPDGSTFKNVPEALYVTDVRFQHSLHPVGNLTETKPFFWENTSGMAKSMGVLFFPMDWLSMYLVTIVEPGMMCTF